MTKILVDRCVVEQALEALDDIVWNDVANLQRNAIEALRAALEQPVEQRPFTVLVRKHSWHLDTWEAAPCGFPDYGKAWADERINVYTYPQPPRQPLTDEEIISMWEFPNDLSWMDSVVRLVRAIESAHGIGGEI